MRYMCNDVYGLISENWAFFFSCDGKFYDRSVSIERFTCISYAVVRISVLRRGLCSELRSTEWARPAGWQAGERHRLVSQSSRLWMLAVGNRCQHSDAQPAVSGAVCSRRGKIDLKLTLLYFFNLMKSILINKSCNSKNNGVFFFHLQPCTVFTFPFACSV